VPGREQLYRDCAVRGMEGALESGSRAANEAAAQLA
jgi:hypothetical protein